MQSPSGKNCLLKHAKHGRHQNPTQKQPIKQCVCVCRVWDCDFIGFSLLFFFLHLFLFFILFYFFSFSLSLSFSLFYTWLRFTQLRVSLVHPDLSLLLPENMSFKTCHEKWTMQKQHTTHLGAGPPQSRERMGKQSLSVRSNFAQHKPSQVPLLHLPLAQNLHHCNHSHNVIAHATCLQIFWSLAHSITKCKWACDRVLDG